jgi:hypothetical protein
VRSVQQRSTIDDCGAGDWPAIAIDDCDCDWKKAPAEDDSADSPTGHARSGWVERLHGWDDFPVCPRAVESGGEPQNPPVAYVFCDFGGASRQFYSCVPF